jgi:hypothetical protein
MPLALGERRSVLPLLSLFLLACGTEVIVYPPGSSGPGGGDGGAGAHGGQEPNGPGGGGEGGGEPACGRTDDRFQMALYAPDGSEWGCSLGSKSHLGGVTADGVVVYSDPATLTIDGCAPAPECNSFLYTTVDIAAANLANPVPPGAYVRIEAAVWTPIEPGGCAHFLTIRNLPALGGEPNPYEGDFVWLAAGDGGLTPPPDLPVDIAAEALGCFPSEVGDDHLLRFSGSGSVLTVPMGEERVGLLIAGHPSYRVRNLRSFDVGSIGDPWNRGWWLVIDDSDF